MPKIKAFYGIRPNPDYAGEIVLNIENLSLEEAKAIRQKNPYSYVNMLVPKLDNIYLRGSKHELAFQKINENFEDFLDKGVLIRDVKQSIYIYRITREFRSQTGIWAVTSIDDYLNDVIKKHELTRPDRETVLINYMQQTGIDANPVLITYSSNPEINTIIKRVCKILPDLSFTQSDAKHELWKIDFEEDVNALIAEFSKLSPTYIADGHHRASAASLLAIEQRKLNPKYTGDEEYNFSTSVYMASDQLDIYGFNRIVKDLNNLTSEEFLKNLSDNFHIIKIREVIMPSAIHEFGMYLDGSWYKLTAKLETYQTNSPVEELDVSILQNYVLSPILNITDPTTDPRISFGGGILPVDDLVKQVDQKESAVVFTLFPTSIEQLTRVADAGEVMPPKSTWFEPKFQVGLLVHQIF